MLSAMTSSSLTLMLIHQLKKSLLGVQDNKINMTHWRSLLQVGRGANRNGWTTFILGSFFGFFIASTLSGIVSLHVFSDDQAASADITTTALRALAAVRHFPESNGWGLVHIFYGDNSHLPQQNTATASRWFGEWQQDYLVSQLLHEKRNGYFVDLTANHAINSSKTYALETQYGWNGLCVAPNPDSWVSLSHRKCDVVAVGSRMQENTNDDKERVISSSNEGRLRYTVQLRKILERFEAPRVIDYLSLNNLDGEEHSVIETFPFDRYRFNVITMEGTSDDMPKVLEERGYIKVLQKKHAVRESLWIHRSVQHMVNMKALEGVAQRKEITQQNQETERP